MRHLFLFTVPLILTLFLSGCSLIRPQPAGLSITTSVPAAVSLDGKEVGTTPYSAQDLKAKKYEVKLEPTDRTYLSHTLTLSAAAGVQAAIDWTFGKTDDESKGIVVELQGSQKKGASELEVVTSPDNVPIMVDNQSKGFSPLLIDDLTPGSYTISFQAPGFEPLTKTVNILEGKRIVMTAKLAKKPDPIFQASPSATPTPGPSTSPKPTAKATARPTSATPSASVAKPYVEILETPTGFLRVRNAPSTTGTEIGRLNTGETVPYAGDTQDNWFKITFKAATSSAWVSGQYARLVQ